MNALNLRPAGVVGLGRNARHLIEQHRLSATTALALANDVDGASAGSIRIETVGVGPDSPRFWRTPARLAGIGDSLLKPACRPSPVIEPPLIFFGFGFELVNFSSCWGDSRPRPTRPKPARRFPNLTGSAWQSDSVHAGCRVCRVVDQAHRPVVEGHRFDDADSPRKCATSKTSSRPAATYSPVRIVRRICQWVRRRITRIAEISLAKVFDDS